MRRTMRHWALAALAAPIATAAAAATLTGVVLDTGGKPLEYANVGVAALHTGAVADEHGRFTLELPVGHYELSIGQIGYQAVRRAVDLPAAGAELRVTLPDAPVPVGEVVVAASSFGREGKSEGATLKRMDVFMTPGGTADVFQSLRALPGINAPDEGAALYVRGGDPHESLIRLDGAEVGHPYHYESASGGLFSSFAAYMLKSAYFSSGGFPARYGGALSGVLDVETQDPWNLRTVSVGANMVGGGASTSWPLQPPRPAEPALRHRARLRVAAEERRRRRQADLPLLAGRARQPARARLGRRARGAEPALQLRRRILGALAQPARRAAVGPGGGDHPGTHGQRRPPGLRGERALRRARPDGARAQLERAPRRAVGALDRRARRLRREPPPARVGTHRHVPGRQHRSRPGRRHAHARRTPARVGPGRVVLSTRRSAPAPTTRPPRTSVRPTHARRSPGASTATRRCASPPDATTSSPRPSCSTPCTAIPGSGRCAPTT